MLIPQNNKQRKSIWDYFVITVTSYFFDTHQNKLFRRLQGKSKQQNAWHVTAHLTVFASQEWLNTVHRVAQIQIKGSCCYALDIPAELSAKIVQVLFHLYHTEETENKRRGGKQWIYKVTIYSDRTKHTAEEWQTNIKYCTLTLPHTQGVACTIWRGERFIFSSSTFQIDEIKCAKQFSIKELWNWRITINKYVPSTSNEFKLTREN